jgi:predicted acylesterase/phospholipase RssA
MKVLSFSGGATKIGALAAHGKNILKEYKPDVMVGVSAGSILTLPMLLGKHEEIKDLVTSLKFSDFFPKSPVNKKGKITPSGYFRGITKGAFGVMNLKKTLTRFVSEGEFNEFRSGETKIYSGVFNMTKGEFELVLINSLSYDEYFLYTTASSTIPVYCNPVKIGQFYYYDGGLKYHNAASHFISNNGTKELISVYSRPEKNESLDWGYNGKYLGRNLSKSIDSMVNSISYMNEKMEREICESRKIKLSQKYSPDILKGVYDIDHGRLKLLYQEVDSQYL